MLEAEIFFIRAGSEIISAPSFDQILLKALNRLPEPFKIKLSDGTVYYFHNHSIELYLQLGNTDVLQQLLCDNLVRNKVELHSLNQIVDPGSLWLQRGNRCILIDEDIDMETAYESTLFETAI